MKRSILGYFGGLALAILVQPMVAQAAIEASSYLNIFNYRVINTATGLPVTAGVGGDIIILATGAGSTAEATLNGFTDLNIGVGVDAPIASSDGSGSPLGAFENTFSPRPLAVALPYARADTAGSGTVATLLPGPVTTGATAESIADVVIPNTPSITNIGVASNTIASSTVFVRILSPLSVILDFDALLDITLDYSLPPADLLLTGSASFETLIIGTGITVGGSTSGSFSFKPTELNTGLLTQGTAGVGGVQVSDDFTSPVITLEPGTYVFNLTQGTTASIAPVPEAASVLTWVVLSLCGAGAAYRVRGRRA